MPTPLHLIVAGVAAGLAAAAVMSAYQAATAALFEQDTGNADPANVKAADGASRAATGEPITQKRRETAGSLVHYATGIALGVIYVMLVAHWLPAALGFGAAFGIAVAILLDDIVVPAFGWGSWPWATPISTHLYGLTSHVVFGVVLEAVRRLALTVAG